MASFTSYKNLQDRTLDLIGKADTTTRSRIKNWLNEGHSDYVMRELWPFREATGTLSTVASTQEYTLSSSFTDMDAQNIISVALQNTTNIKLPYIPYNQLRASHPDFDFDAAGVPQKYYIKAGKIGFWPEPNDVYSIAIDYYKIPTEMSADADEPMMPVNYRSALMHYAISREQDYNGDPDLAIKEMNSFENQLNSARMALLTQPVDSESFRILGPADARQWTGLTGEIA